MSNKKLISIYLNEFNYDYILKNSKQFKCHNILRLFKKKKLVTKTNDKIQNKNLDPWVQNVSINTGITSKKHKIFNLGEDIFIRQKQIWDLLAINKKKVLIWGPMNAKLKSNRNLRVFFPDPWNTIQQTEPKRLKYLTYLPNYYARNYLKPKIIYLTIYSILFFWGLLRNGYLLKLLKYLPFLFKSIFSKSLDNFLLFLLLDLISITAVRVETNKNNPDFSLVFLNSIAHFQHNHWNDLSKKKLFFKFLDLLCLELLNLENLYKSTLIFNGFSQKRNKDKYIIRPIDPNKFLKIIGIRFKKLNQNMTNGGIIFFKNNKEKIKNIKLLKKVKLGNFDLFEISILDDRTIFYRIKVISKIPLINMNAKNLNKNLVYDKKSTPKRSNKNEIKLNFADLLHFKFIKSTGTHTSEGVLFYKNINIDMKYVSNEQIFNHHIFKIIKDHFYER